MRGGRNEKRREAKRARKRLQKRTNAKQLKRNDEKVMIRSIEDRGKDKKKKKIRKGRGMRNGEKRNEEGRDCKRERTRHN